MYTHQRSLMEDMFDNNYRTNVQVTIRNMLIMLTKQTMLKKPISRKNTCFGLSLLANFGRCEEKKSFSINYLSNKAYTTIGDNTIKAKNTNNVDNADNANSANNSINAHRAKIVSMLSRLRRLTADHSDNANNADNYSKMKMLSVLTMLAMLISLTY